MWIPHPSSSNLLLSLHTGVRLLILSIFCPEEPVMADLTSPFLTISKTASIGEDFHLYILTRLRR